MQRRVQSRLPSPALLLLLLVAGCHACLESPWRLGYMTGTSAEVERLTLPAAAPGTCSCCARCHQRADCAGIAYNSATLECRLYDAVAGYDTLTPDPSWQYFLRPGRSGHQQFCRDDADCTAPGDFCRGRVCTELDTVSCKVIKITFGAGERYGGTIHRMYGWIGGEPASMSCMMLAPFDGATRIYRENGDHPPFTETELRTGTRRMDLKGPDTGYSIISRADIIRQLGTSATYKLWLFTANYNKQTLFELPRDAPVIADAVRPSVGVVTMSDASIYSSTGGASAPYYVSDPASVSIISVRADNLNTQDEGAVVRRDGAIGSWGGAGNGHALAIRE